MTKNELGKAIYDTSHLTGSFKLRSGAVSTEYFDKYLFESEPRLLEEISNYLLKLLPNDFGILAGLEMGGIPIATSLSLKTGKPAVFVRKKAKEYGTCKIAEGADIKRKHLLMVEDVVTSGGQIVLSVQELRNMGAIITNAICVIDRESGGAKNLAEIGVELKPLFTMSELKQI